MNKSTLYVSQILSLALFVAAYAIAEGDGDQKSASASVSVKVPASGSSVAAVDANNASVAPVDANAPAPKKGFVKKCTDTLSCKLSNAKDTFTDLKNRGPKNWTNKERVTIAGIVAAAVAAVYYAGKCIYQTCTEDQKPVQRTKVRSLHY